MYGAAGYGPEGEECGDGGGEGVGQCGGAVGVSGWAGEFDEADREGEVGQEEDVFAEPEGSDDGI